MEYLRATSPCTVVIGPFIHSTDGISAMTAIEISSATIVDIYKTTAKTDITTSVAGANAMAHVANGYYSLVLTSSNTDTVGRFKITANAPSALSLWHDYSIIPAPIYDALMTGTTTLDASFAAGAQASSLLAAEVSIASSLVWVASAHAQILVASASAMANLAYESTLTTVDTVADSIKVETASSLAKIDLLQTDMTSSLVWVASAHANIVTMDAIVDSIKVETASSLVWIASTHTNLAAVKVETASSLAKIDLLQTDMTSSLVWVASAHANITTVDTVVDGIQVDVTSVLTNYAQASAVAAVKVETASSLVWIASAHAQILVASASAMTNLAYGSAVAAISTTAIASAVWDEAIAPHITSGTTGNALSAAGSAGDPWSTALPGSYGAGTAGLLLSDTYGVTTVIASAMVTAEGVLDEIKVDTASSLVWIASAHANITTVDTVVDSIKVETASSLVWIASAHAQVLVASASAMTNLAYGSSLSAVKVDTASSLVWIASAYTHIASVVTQVDSIHDTDLPAVKVDTASALVWIASAHTNVGLLQVDMTSSLVNMALLPTAATINAQVLDVLNVDTFAEPGQGAPAATASVVSKLGYVYKFLRNKIETTSSQTSVYNDAGSTVDQKSTIGDDGSVFTRGEFGSGP